MCVQCNVYTPKAVVEAERATTEGSDEKGKAAVEVTEAELGSDEGSYEEGEMEELLELD